MKKFNFFSPRLAGEVNVPKARAHLCTFLYNNRRMPTYSQYMCCDGIEYTLLYLYIVCTYVYVCIHIYSYHSVAEKNKTSSGTGLSSRNAIRCESAIFITYAFYMRDITAPSGFSTNQFIHLNKWNSC